MVRYVLRRKAECGHSIVDGIRLSLCLCMSTQRQQILAGCVNFAAKGFQSSCTLSKMIANIQQ